VIVTRLAVAVCVLVFGFLCYLAVRGSAAATGLVVTVAALVVLVGGGNWLGGRTTPHGAPPGPRSSRFYGVDLPEGGVDAGPGPGGPEPPAEHITAEAGGEGAVSTAEPGTAGPDTPDRSRTPDAGP
jgi:hypothetical protein